MQELIRLEVLEELEASEPLESFSPGHQFLAAKMDISFNFVWMFQTDLAVRLDGENGQDHGALMDAVGMQYFCMKTA